MLLISLTAGGCTNKEQAAYQLGAQAQQQLDSGNVAEARKTIDEALRTRDDLVDLYLLKAKIELARKSPDGAFAAFYNAMSLDPVNQPALQAVAMLGLQTGHIDDAESAAQKLLNLTPQQPTALLVLGLIAVERHRYPQALDAANRILANSPTDEGGLILKARALFLSGSKDEARSLIDHAVQLTGSTAGLARISLELARANGDAAGMFKALAELKKLAQLDPDLLRDEANLRYKTGDAAGGRTAVLTALRDPRTTPEQAVRLLDLWREHDPSAPAAGSLGSIGSPALRELLARYLIERNRQREALDLVAGVDKGNAPGIRARALFGLGQVAPAQELAEAVIDKDPSQCDARLVLASIALKSGDMATAVTNGQQSAAECPEQVDSWLTTAQAYLNSRQDAQAERVYRDAIARNADSYKLHAAFAAWLARRGKQPEATGVARHLVRFTPNRTSSWALLANTCADADCKAEAAAGLARARASFTLDHKPGEVSTRGLFGSLSEAQQP